MRGFLYILVNSSFPGLVKVGKTTRSPSERAAELSSATGVPTPFVVAFHQEFENCHDAERELHDLLSRRSLRLTPNREFFQAGATDVVRVILEMPGAITEDEGRNGGGLGDLGGATTAVPRADDEGRARRIMAVLDDRIENDPAIYEFRSELEKETEWRLAQRLLLEDAEKGDAEACYHFARMIHFSWGEVRAAEALSFYEMAARLGCWPAYMGAAFEASLLADVEKVSASAEAFHSAYLVNRHAMTEAQIAACDRDLMLLLLSSAKFNMLPVPELVAFRGDQIVRLLWDLVDDLSLDSEYAAVRPWVGPLCDRERIYLIIELISNQSSARL